MGPWGPYITGKMGPRGPILPVGWGRGGPNLGGAHFTLTPGPPYAQLESNSK